MDRDPEAIAAAREIRDPRFAPVHARFSELLATLAALHAGGADGVLFDLGVSSPQLDDARRGFSFRVDAPLDMRMDPTRGVSAAERLERAEEAQLSQELEASPVAPQQALTALNPQGRVAVIRFHSPEDRIVRNFMRVAARPALPERLPIRARELPPPKLRIIGRPARAGAEEVRTNPRARSAVLRIAEKLT